MLHESIDKLSGTDKDYYLLVIDQNGIIQFANSYLITNLELDPKKINECCFFNLIEPRYQNSFKDSLDRVQQNGLPVSIEVSARNGSLHWIKWEISKHKSDSAFTDKYFCMGYDIVGKQTVNKMHRVAKRNYEAIMEGLTIGVIMQDITGEILAANRKVAEIFETSLEEIYKTNWLANLWQKISNEKGVFSSENNPPLYAFKTGTVQNHIRASFTTRTGELKTILINSQPLYEKNQVTPVSVVSSFMDISREKALEQEVHRQEILFHTFNNNTPNLSWIVDEDARLLYANNSFFNYLGITNKAIGRNILDLLPNDIGEAFKGRHRQILETGLQQEMEEKMFLANGREMVFWINLFPIDTATGKKMIGGEAIDITGRFRTEEKLRKVNERLRYLSHMTTDAIWEWDMRTGKIYRNQILQDLIGYSADTTQNLSWWFRRVHPEDRRKLRDVIKHVIENKKQSWESEYRIRSASGNYIIVYDRGYIIYDNDLPVKMIGSLHDITHVKELEAKLIKDKIQHQKDITETIFAVQEKERTRIGHELHDNVNQLLGTSKMFVDLLQTVTPEDKELKTKITGYILMAIEEIRRLSKEMVTPQLKENGLVASITTLVEDLKAAHIMNVLFHHQDDVELLSSGKKVTLFRIVQEQVKNIMKYSKAKNLVIDLRMNVEDVQLIIEDDGVGFDPNQTRRGIGLSNIYERTRFYNGSVIIKTEPGKGCRMIVRIPLTL